MHKIHKKKIEINPKKLYKGCIFTAVAHAVTVGENPRLNYEHYWDGINYCMDNSRGCCGTITFDKKYIIGVFQNLAAGLPYREAMNYFKGASVAIVKLAQAETFQYVPEGIDGEERPYITAAFWGNWDELYSTQEYDEFMENSAHILDIQLMDKIDALRACDDCYGLTNGQMDLILSLSKRRSRADLSVPIILKKNSSLYGDMDEVRESMGELNIQLEE